VKRIVTFDGDLQSARSPMSVTLVLEDAVDVGRGDVICAGGDLPEVAHDLRATLIWFGDTPLDRQASYIAKHTTRTVRARIATDENVAMNDIVDVDIETSAPLVLRSYGENRAAGSFIHRPQHQRHRRRGLVPRLGAAAAPPLSIRANTKAEARPPHSKAASPARVLSRKVSLAASH
jgi:sulfate adenylyltransferase subunit 1 (EFTu-like GTPase family)